MPSHPSPLAKDADRWLGWERFDYRAFLDAQCPGSLAANCISFESFFHRLFGRAPPPVLTFAQGAQFAASRDALRRIPKPTYERLLKEIEEGLQIGNDASFEHEP